MQGKGRSEMKDDTILFDGDAAKDPTDDDDDDDDDGAPLRGLQVD